MPTFASQRVRVTLCSHVNALLTPFRLHNGCTYPFFSRTLIYCLICFLAECACIPFLTFKSTAYSIFACQYVRPSLLLHSNPLLTLYFRLPVCAYILFLAFKSTAHYSFVSSPRTYAHPFSRSVVNKLLTPLSSPKWVHPFFHIQKHYSLHFHLSGSASSPFPCIQIHHSHYYPCPFSTASGCVLPFLAIKSTPYSIFVSQARRITFSLHLNPLLTPSIFGVPDGASMTCLLIKFHCLLHSRLLAGVSSLFSHLNPLLTPFSYPSMYVHPLSRTYIHCLLRFRVPVCTYTFSRN